MKKISDLALIGKSTKIADGVEIGPFAVIEDGAEIGVNVKIAAHAYIFGGTTIGEGAQIHAGACIGDLPQDLLFDKSKKTFTKIGRNTVIREHTTIHRATAEEGATVVGDNCYLMASSHVGHDCHVGSNVIIANGALLAGHVEVEDYAFISGNVVIHQFCRIGAACMIGGFTGINKDVPPYMMVRGPSVVRGINLVGLRRLKFPREVITGIKEAYKLIYMSGLNTSQALSGIQKLKPAKELDHLVEFIKTSKRGICKAKDEKDEFYE
ncbi:MAG: acyl-ACP--UDP-N-acetylglucosamine O-acyltransferase [Candidatus Omnitrophota bacterium]